MEQLKELIKTALEQAAENQATLLERAFSCSELLPAARHACDLAKNIVHTDIQELAEFLENTGDVDALGEIVREYVQEQAGNTQQIYNVIPKNSDIAAFNGCNIADEMPENFYHITNDMNTDFAELIGCYEFQDKHNAIQEITELVESARWASLVDKIVYNLAAEIAENFGDRLLKICGGRYLYEIITGTIS